MCWLCDEPGMSWDGYLDRVRGIVAATGWAVQGVERDRIHPPWAYSVGLTLAGQPELVVTGLPIPRATHLINELAAHLMHAAAPEPGERIQLDGGPLTEIVRIGVPAAHLRVATELYGRRVRALQMVHADDRGRWPWDTGYRGVRGGQPVLGVRATQAARL
jgi:uncharacterized protein DUF4262